MYNYILNCISFLGLLMVSIHCHVLLSVVATPRSTYLYDGADGLSYATPCSAGCTISNFNTTVSRQVHQIFMHGMYSSKMPLALYVGLTVGQVAVVLATCMHAELA